MGKVGSLKNRKNPEPRYYPVPAADFVTAGRFVPSAPPLRGDGAANPYVSGGQKKKIRSAKLALLTAKAKKKYAEMSLKGAFSMYVTFFMLLALILSVLSVSVFAGVRSYAENSYIQEYTDAEADEDSASALARLSDQNRAAAGFLVFLAFISVPVIFVACILVSGILFYKNRLGPPIAVLNDASKNISERNLQFSVAYKRDDEMGRLCGSFEKMRGILETNYSEMWRQMEERKRLNSVFSHDLRTPLTVLKGNIHMLGEYLTFEEIQTEKVREIAKTMENHVERMENYVEIMSKLQKLDDIEISRVRVPGRELTDTLRNVAEMLCKDRSLNFFDEVNGGTLFADPEIIISVAENLISNAVRYAKRRVAVVCGYRPGTFTLSVSDDGGGFSEDDLKLATNPFYKAAKNIFDSHFGLGLNISKVLAERHGGKLEIMNVDAGGALVRAEFSE